MVQTPCGVLKRRDDVVRLQVGIVREYLLVAFAGRQEFQNVDDPHAHAPNVWTASALCGVHGNPIEQRWHLMSLGWRCHAFKFTQDEQ